MRVVCAAPVFGCGQTCETSVGESSGTSARGMGAGDRILSWEWGEEAGTEGEEYGGRTGYLEGMGEGEKGLYGCENWRC
jgi:hypothetical protein